LDVELFNVATSSAVSSGINSKDAMCLKLTGRTAKAENHPDAVQELKQAGAVAAPLATTLGRLLRLKGKSQYQASSVARADAERAVNWAERLHDGARSIVTS
jgi:hypothetical protein